MTTVNVYLNFMGNCEEAFNFYKSVFGGEFSYIGKFKDFPVKEGQPSIPKEMQDQIIHVALPISEETMLMGSDTFPGDNNRHIKGNNFSISVNLNSNTEADRIFAALSESGQVTMPMHMAIWGDYFGTLVDKYEVPWMICSFPEK